MADEIKKAIVSVSELPPVNPGNKRNLRFRILGLDNVPISSWSSLYFIDGQGISNVTISTTALDVNSFLATWGDENDRPAYDVFVSYGIGISSWSRTAGIVTLNLAAPCPFEIDDRIDVNIPATSSDHISVTNATVTAKTDTSVSYACSVAGPNSGTDPGSVHFSDSHYGVSDTNYMYHGTTSTHQYSFLANPYTSANVAIQIEGTRKSIDPATRITNNTSMARTYTFA